MEKSYFTVNYDNKKIIVEKKGKEKIMKIGDQIIQKGDFFIKEK